MQFVIGIYRVLSGKEMERYPGDPCRERDPKPVRLFMPANNRRRIDVVLSADPITVDEGVGG